MNIFFAKILKKRVVIMVEGGFEDFMKSFHRFLALPILRFVDVIFICSPYQEKIFKQYNLKTTIALDFVPDLYEFTDRKEKGPIILISKTMLPYSNHKCGIMAFGIIKKKFPDAKLIITSTGPLENELKEFVNVSGLNDVTFVGDIKYEEMPRIYAKSAILLHATNRDIFPRTILESFASGTAVVATKVQGIPYMIMDGENGLLTEPNNPKEMAEKVLILLENPIRLKFIVKNARKIAVEKYTWAAYRKRLAKAYGISE